jgi:hypothetical protein
MMIELEPSKRRRGPAAMWLGVGRGLCFERGL